MNVLGSVYDLFNTKVVSVSCSTYSPYYNEVVSKCLRALAVRSSIDDKPCRLRAEMRCILLPQANTGLHPIGGTSYP